MISAGQSTMYSQSRKITPFTWLPLLTLLPTTIINIATPLCSYLSADDDVEQDVGYNQETIRMMVGDDGWRSPAYSDSHHHPGLTIQTTDKHGRSSVFIINKDGQPMLANPMSPPHSPDNVPQIRITFPDEQDDAGMTRGGRVVVVRMGETSVGLEPVREEQLPVYEKENNSQFYSIDMDKIGGLKEKDRTQFH
ncbi:unnamed protein product [Parascedosporium putredinis]|uniref:Uncharacterized protein n=1 Tax=Parascedosporium putredinis TaxID=1442378 RepID=A0A9P1HCL8_9PEZI|nr:unnamed protein product [Parascedosporium putredinis]CAI8003181.1 unnamed protein product [Parascedosporium putredinis]